MKFFDPFFCEKVIVPTILLGRKIIVYTKKRLVEPLEIIGGIIALVVGGVVLGVVYDALWKVPEQLAEQSGNEKLQKSIQTGKGIINTADETEDKFALAKAILALALIIGVPASIIKAIKDL